MKKLILVLVSILSVRCEIKLSGFHLNKLVTGTLQSQMFDDGEEFSYGEIVIEEITYDEYKLKNGVNVIVDLITNEKARKYCSLTFSYYDNDNTKIPIEITDLEYLLGTRDRYFGEISYEKDETNYSGGIAVEVCEFGVKIETYVNKHYIEGFYTNDEIWPF